MEEVSEKNNPKVSVIVPVYKVEKYLEDCVNSILAQSFGDFELILVDDGSPDKCGNICDAFAEKDSRVRVIHQQNMGLSGARNTGIELSCGEYLTFIDSDDLIAPRYLELLMWSVTAGHAEIAVCSMEEFTDGNEQETLQHVNCAGGPLSVFTGRDGCIMLYEGDKSMPVYACAKLFVRSLICDARFPVGRIHEDQAFIPVICYKANSIAALNAPLYCYRTREDSITRDRFTLKRYDDIWAIDNCILFFEEKGEKEIVEAAYKKRKRLLAVYSIYARRDGVSVPKEYQISLLSALKYLRNHVAPAKYEYYLAQVSPKLARVFVYEQKLKRIFSRTKHC